MLNSYFSKRHPKWINKMSHALWENVCKANKNKYPECTGSQWINKIKAFKKKIKNDQRIDIS